MSSGRQLLDTTRTVFIRTSGTRLGTGIASLRDLNDAFQDAFGDDVEVTGFRKIGNGLIVEVNSEANKNKSLGGQLCLLGLKCRVYTHTMLQKQPERQKASQLQNSVATSQQDDNDHNLHSQQLHLHKKNADEPTQLQTIAIQQGAHADEGGQQQRQHSQNIKDALGLLDSHSVTPQVTATTLCKFKTAELASQLIANATTSLMSELVRLLCDGDKEFRAHFADALASEFVHTQRRARDEELALKAEHTTVAAVTTTSMPLLTPTSQHMATLALLIGKLAGSRTLMHSEVMILVRMCAPDVAIAALSCDMFALCTMTEHMTGAPAALVGECVARLLRTERFCPPLPFALSAEIRRVCTIQSVSKVATVATAAAAPPPGGAAPGPTSAPATMAHRLRPALPPLAQHVVAPVIRVAPTSDSILLVEIFGATLAREQGARLRRAALDREGLMALLDFVALDRVAIFARLDIPLGQAVQMSAALERYKARIRGDVASI